MQKTTETRADRKLPSTLASVGEVEALAHEFALRAGFDEDTASNLAMVAREAAVNAVVHGNRYSADKHVFARCELSDEALRIAIRDQGEGIDIATVPDPVAPENLLRTSGRGIFLMRAFADQVDFRSITTGTNRGTELTLVKLRTPGKHPIHRKEEIKMSLKVKTRSVDGVTILDLSGRVTLGDGSVVLRDAVKDVLSKGDLKILLNLGDVDYIDSSGIGELVSAFTSAKNAGGEVKLLNLTKKVHDLLQITKLYTVFDVQDSETAAVGSFAR